jgi:hypothetical protein
LAESVIYEPSKWGQTFHELRDSRGEVINELLGAGAAGPGKSMVLLMDPISKVIIEDKRTKLPQSDRLWIPPATEHAPGGSRGWALHLRRTRPMLEQTIARSHRMFKAFDPGAKWDQSKTLWTFSCGYRIQFGHCKDPNDWEQYMSNEYDHICYDELVQFDEEQYDQINTRLRSSDPVLATLLKIRSMSNPLMRRATGENYTVKNPYWVRDRFVRPAPDGGKIFRKKLIRGDGTIAWHTVCYLRATLYDNPDKEFVRQYEAQLLSAKPHIRAALLYGRWDASEHSFFDEWNPHLHVVKPFTVPDEWTYFRSMDWGFKVPGCVHWWAMDPDENLYCIKELNFKGKVVDQVAAMVKEIEIDLGLWDERAKRSSITGPADTQLWEQRGGNGKSMIRQFEEKGVFWDQADKKSRATNAGHLYKRLSDSDGGTKQPGVVFIDVCKKMIETLPGIQGELLDPDTPMDGGEDHWADSAYYASAYASRGRIAIPKRKAKADPWEQESKKEQTHVSTSFGYGSSV